MRTPLRRRRIMLLDFEVSLVVDVLRSSPVTAARDLADVIDAQRVASTDECQPLGLRRLL